MIPTMDWSEHQDWERRWWGDCLNTYGEETKQLQYAKRMGLKAFHDSQGVHFDLAGQSVLDLGGGPVSLLLKCVRGHDLTVVDPCEYPFWTRARYQEAGITYLQRPAEEFTSAILFDECWMYNVLQHTEDPEAICRVARAAGRIVRVFDWLEIGVAPGHPQNLTEAAMNRWLGGEGKVVPADRGQEYFGVFKGDHYVERA